MQQMGLPNYCISSGMQAPGMAVLSVSFATQRWRIRQWWVLLLTGERTLKRLDLAVDLLLHTVK